MGELHRRKKLSTKKSSREYQWKFIRVASINVAKLNGKNQKKKKKLNKEIVQCRV